MGSIGCFFLDSGAFSLYNKHCNGVSGTSKKYAFFETKEYWDYVDTYAEFLKKEGWACDYYANVDVIRNPELSYRTLKYLEKKHKLKPVPVIHAGTSVKWIKKHLDEGYEYIGIGGLGQRMPKSVYCKWATEVFVAICPASNGHKPLARTHGFAMTAWELLKMFPWWSVDSASWVKAAAFGTIYVPLKSGGKFDFKRNPMSVQVSEKSPDQTTGSKHYRALNKAEQAIMYEWLDHIGVPFGKTDKKGEMLEEGVSSHYRPRAKANLLFFEAMAASMPEYPWAWKPNISYRPSLGI